MYGKQLKKMREGRNLSQNELAKATGISQQNISLWEKDQRTPSIEFCVILANYYGITLDALIDREIPQLEPVEQNNVPH